MRGIQRVRNLNPQIEQQFHLQRTTGDPVLQRRAFQKFHGDERLAVLLANLINRADVGMVQCGGRARFAPKTFQGLRILGYIEGQKFQRDKSAELSILRLVNDTHASAAEFLEDSVMGNREANKRLGIGHAPHSLVCAPNASQSTAPANCQRSPYSTFRKSINSWRKLASVSCSQIFCRTGWYARCHRGTAPA